MTEVAHNAAVPDEDRLPWLEAVDDEHHNERVPVARLVALIVAALAALGIVIGGYFFLRSQNGAPPKDPKLIVAQEGDYKVKPDEPGGMKVEGKGGSAFAASEGAEAMGTINNASLPETPVKAIKGSHGADGVGKAKLTTVVPMSKPGGALIAKPAMGAMEPGTVQLGAYGSEAKANTAWATMSKRFAHLAPLAKSVVAAEVGGATVYRLRAVAGGQAAAVCAELKAAGENCLRVN